MNTFSDPRQLESYAKTHLVEELMMLVGRSEPDPVRVRRELEQLTLEQLRTALNKLMEAIC